MKVLVFLEKRSITLPLGKIEITRPVKTLDIILKNMHVRKYVNSIKKECLKKKRGIHKKNFNINN